MFQAANIIGKLGDQRHIMVNQENRKTLASFISPDLVTAPEKTTGKG
ncbi:MAG: hypothetical protein MUP02_08470 [Actinobacteria bacterium]|nr:hypothetical protein [Actinomycetota bacterium]